MLRASPNRRKDGSASFRIGFYERKHQWLLVLGGSDPLSWGRAMFDPKGLWVATRRACRRSCLQRTRSPRYKLIQSSLYMVGCCSTSG